MVWVMVRGTPSGLEGGQSRKRLRSDTMETTEAQIIEFGDSARSKLLQTAEREGVDLSTTYLRIAVVPGGCSGLTYDLGWDTTRKDTDTLLTVAPMNVGIDPRSAAYLEGTRLEVSDGLEGKGFHFDNPQAVRNCACGESFGL